MLIKSAKIKSTKPIDFLSKIPKINIKFLITAIIVITLFNIVQKNTVDAAVGTHLGAGDIGTQVSIMDGVIGQQNGDFPVTIMVDMGTSSESLQELNAAVKNNKLVPIVRINFVCTSSLADSVLMVNNVKRIFGDGVVITFGNEVNNQSSDRAGCTNWQTYATNYRGAKALGGVSPSALDWYMGEPLYKADKFLSESGLINDYASASIRTANAYGCIGQTSESCDPLTTDTQNVGVQGTTGKQLYITEFSISPGGEDPPDKNLKNVVKFIKERAGEMNAVHITPLVRNVCSELQSEGEWLIYVNGDLFTVHGTKVELDCTPIDGLLASYTPKDPNNYYTYPLNFRWDESLNNTKKKRDVLIHNLVKDQGYQVFCPADPVKITKKVSKEAGKYFSLYPSDQVTLGGGMGQVAVLNSAKIAMLRGNEIEDETLKISSLEGFFGANNPEDKRPETGQGTAASLLSLEQQCQVKFNKVMSIQEMCGPIGDACIANSDIPGTNINHWEMMGRMEKYVHGNNKVTCENWAKPWDNKLTDAGISEDEFLETQDALLKMPINFDNVYRMAYLVISPPQNIDQGNISHGCDGDNDDVFWFMEKHVDTSPIDTCASPTHANLQKHAPVFVAFKIPDFGTNRSYSLGYIDGGEITASVLRPLELTQEIKFKEEGRRIGLLNEVGNKQEIRLLPEDGGENTNKKKQLPVNCSGTPNCEDPDYPGDFPIHLREALVDVINGYGATCDGVSPSSRMENAGDIFTYTGVDDEEDREWPEPFESGVGANSATRVWDWGLKLRGANAGGTDLDRPAPNWLGETDTKPRVHIVAPIGANLESITASLNAMFSVEGLDKMKSTNCLVDAGGTCGVAPEVYPIKGASFGFTKSQDTKEFYDPNLPCPADEDGVIVVPCNNANFNATVEDVNESNQLYFPGAKLGWMVLKVQESLRSVTSRAGQYIQSCERTEDLFAGRCSGTPGAAGAISGGDHPGMSADCKPITGSSKKDNPCHVDNPLLRKYFKSDAAAYKASAICYRESRGAPLALNNGCTTGKSVDYSVGLFQINLIVPGRCTAENGRDAIASYTWNPPSCKIEYQDALDDCTADLQDAETSIAKAAKMSGGGTNWGAWKTNAPGVCHVE